MTHRVVVTGVGVVSALGVDAATHMQGLREGRSGIGPLSMIDAEGLSIKIGAEAKEFDGEARFSRSQLTLWDRVTQMAIAAGEEAVQSAGLELGDEESLRAGAVVGTSMGGMHTLDENYDLIYRQGKSRIHPFTVPKLMPNAPASHLSMAFGARGPSWAVTTACASSNHAMGQAFQMVRSGALDVAITGGCESQLTFGVLKAWEGLRVMARDACRPFSKNRTGMVQGEGAAIIIFEKLERAIARGAPIWAEVVGFGASSDANDIVQPNQDGASRAMRAALQDAGLGAGEIGYINAHGTATAANDRTECAAIRHVFGEHADGLMVSSTKSMHGHCIGAAGALEMVATLGALRDGVIPPTINYDEPDPDCDLDVVPNEAREVEIEAALSNSFAFGGLNAVVAMRKWRGA
ncbi:MAG: beta-ketoacyl-[acyl-carrier-protein] synthase family protein [Pseudomonadota bacterium]